MEYCPRESLHHVCGEGVESDSTYEVVFRSYTGATVHFYVDKHTGVTKMVEKVPLLDIENETGRINLFDCLKKE